MNLLPAGIDRCNGQRPLGGGEGSVRTTVCRNEDGRTCGGAGGRESASDRRAAKRSEGLGLLSSTKVHIHTTTLKTEPTTAVAAMAAAPQSVTRAAPRTMPAPPAFAPKPPSIAKKAIVETAT